MPEMDAVLDIVRSRHSMEPFVTAAEAAIFLALTKRRVMELARSGEIPAHPVGCGLRKTWRFRLSELAEKISRKDLASNANSSYRRKR